MDKVGEMNGEEGSQNSEITSNIASDEVNKWEQMAQEAGEFKDAEDFFESEIFEEKAPNFVKALSDLVGLEEAAQKVINSGFVVK